MVRRIYLSWLVFLLLAGCHGSSDTDTTVVAGDTTAPVDTVVCHSEPTNGLLAISPYEGVPTAASLSGGLINIDTPLSYFLYVPDNLPASPRPLLVALHGLLGSGDRFAASTELQALADRHGFVIAFPNRGGRNWLWSKDGIDALFIRDVVADVRANRACVDGRKIYLTGHSNGSFMSQRLVCEGSDLFAAAAAMAGGAPTLLGDCTADSTPEVDDALEPVPVMLVHGDEDAVISFGAGEHSLLDWVQRYRCDSMPDGGGELAPFGLVQEYNNCLLPRDQIALNKRNRFVRWRVLHAHNHGWPDGCGGSLDSGCDNHLSAEQFNEELWTYLSAFQRKRAAELFPLALPEALLNPTTLLGSVTVPPDTSTNQDTKVFAHRVDDVGQSVDDQPLQISTDDQLEVQLALEFLPGFNDALGLSELNGCPIDPESRNQYIAGIPVTIRIEGPWWQDERTAITELKASPQRSVAIAVFDNIPADTTVLALSASFPASVLAHPALCGSRELWYKRTLAVQREG